MPATSGVADPSYTDLQDKLFVVLPGTGARPIDHDKLMKIAAHDGYRTLGVSFWNENFVATQCSSAAAGSSTTIPGESFGGTALNCEANFANECAYEVRMERITGTPDPDTRFGGPQHTYKPMDPKDAVAFRVLHALKKLVDKDLLDGVNHWNFEQYCDPTTCDTGSGPVPYVQRIDWS